MLKSCKTCNNGLVLPMIDIISVYHKGASLYIHNVPYTVCTHCNTHEFVDHLSEIKQVAKNLNDEHGNRTFKYETVEIKEKGDKPSVFLLGALVGESGALWYASKDIK
ncbi:YgiT-type zinc finger domain-containing protein [Fictibacillus solisalsi]|uniref:YgiT-type zinc finger domain-containing protein n=1 Tax=Fictibacillus solisalsi TaxID=459525 RepID=A0A1G9VG64_9BACL|nr:YgiT-type zinc finger protein [Fictibacillus solisalsi]SDM71106.1 YgiT-type zinc finger domain-containing protein [Fictibacillus solisalsi]